MKMEGGRSISVPGMSFVHGHFLVSHQCHHLIPVLQMRRQHRGEVCCAVTQSL